MQFGKQLIIPFICTVYTSIHWKRNIILKIDIKNKKK